MKYNRDSACVQTPNNLTPQASMRSTIKIRPASTINVINKNEIESAAAAIAEAVPLSADTIDDNTNRDEAILTTPASFNMNTFITCFKSEPNLSKALSVKHDNVPMLNRGRFIAKKLLGGVSMGNLRLPFGLNSHEKKSVDEFTPKSRRQQATIDRNGESVVTKKIIFDDDVDASSSVIADATATVTNMCKKPNAIDNIDDDEDDVDFDEKENLPDIECDQPNYLEKLKQASINVIQCGGSASCMSRDNASMSDSMIGDVVSPITKSTHRMSKAMQVRRINHISNL